MLAAAPDYALEHLREIVPNHLGYESVNPDPGGSVLSRVCGGVAAP